MGVPMDTLFQIRQYVDHRVPPGGFLFAVLSNDLYEAVGRADDLNRANLPAIAEYVRWNIPVACRGSVEAVRAWIGR